MGYHALLDAGALFERRDVYQVAFDEERAARTPVSLAILGAGGVAQAKYLPAIARLRAQWEPIHLVGLSTLDPRQGRKLSQIWGAPAYRDSHALLREQTPQAVLVASSDDAHRELALAALESGAHVLIEKPIACSLTDAAEICRAAEVAGRVLVTTCNKRFSPPYAEARRLLDSRTVPDPSLFAAKFTLGYEYVDLLAAGTVHVFDLARFFMGEVSRVSAVAARARGENAIVTLEFASGAAGTIVTTATALSLHPWERVEIFGDGAWLEVDDQSTLTLHSAEYEPASVWSPVVPNTLVSAEEWGGYVGLLEEFLALVRGARPRATLLWDGYRALELVHATRRSLSEGRPVVVPLDLD